ncbi:MAG: M15 family metallopeptidase [Christensenellales bacterium]|nr:M15 family metallopeptidase [Clostridiales bacterium]
MLPNIIALLLTILSLGTQSLDAYAYEAMPGGNLFLINRTYKVDRLYVPDDLVVVDVEKTNPEITMRKEAATQLKAMFETAKTEKGYILVAVSGFRSYGTQSAIYKRKVEVTGSKQKANLYVAPPGCSEHQLGLAMDLGRKDTMGLNESFGESPEGQWVAQNAHRFGFIIRYQKEWTEITGYAYEPWHVRYVGVEHASRIYMMNIPLEHYIDLIFEAQRQNLLQQSMVVNQ